MSTSNSKRRSVARDRDRNIPNSRIHPKFRRLLSVLALFTKNYVLFPLLLLMISNFLIPRLVLHYDDVRFLGLDRRIDKVAESLLQNTTKLMQNEIQFVDRKIEKEIKDLRTELREIIADNGIEFGGKLNDIDKRIDSVEVSLTNELNMFLEEFRFKNNIIGKTHKRIDDDYDKMLNEMAEFLQRIIENEIEKHAADGIARVDYAVAGGGGMVVKHSKPYMWDDDDGGFYERLMEDERFGDMFRIHPEAVSILMPSLGEPGPCFALYGNSGYVDIRLRKAIIPEAVTLEHVAQSVAYYRLNAPKDCRVFGWLSRLEHLNSQKMVLLAEFSYDLVKHNIQTFDVSEISYAVDAIRLEFTSNHGDPTQTCIYRFRVHGHDPRPFSHWITQNTSTDDLNEMTIILQ